jgi:hypothetical protein
MIMPLPSQGDQGHLCLTDVHQSSHVTTIEQGLCICVMKREDVHAQAMIPPNVNSQKKK